MTHDSLEQAVREHYEREALPPEVLNRLLHMDRRTGRHGLTERVALWVVVAAVLLLSVPWAWQRLGKPSTDIATGSAIALPADEQAQPDTLPDSPKSPGQAPEEMVPRSEDDIVLADPPSNGAEPRPDLLEHLLEQETQAPARPPQPDDIVLADPPFDMRPQVDVGSGTMDHHIANKASVKDTIRRYAGQLQYCYEARLRQVPNLNGRVEIGWSVYGGKVEGVYVVSNSTHDTELADCIQKKLRNWQFSEDIEGDLSWPFVFREMESPSAE